MATVLNGPLSDEELDKFLLSDASYETDMDIRHANDILFTLRSYPDEVEPLLYERDVKGEKVPIIVCARRTQGDPGAGRAGVDLRDELSSASDAAAIRRCDWPGGSASGSRHP
jgi:hypothetical protein